MGYKKKTMVELMVMLGQFQEKDRLTAENMESVLLRLTDLQELMNKHSAACTEGDDEKLRALIEANLTFVHAYNKQTNRHLQITTIMLDGFERNLNNAIQPRA